MNVVLDLAAGYGLGGWPPGDQGGVTGEACSSGSRIFGKGGGVPGHDNMSILALRMTTNE